MGEGEANFAFHFEKVKRQSLFRIALDIVFWGFSFFGCSIQKSGKGDF